MTGRTEVIGWHAGDELFPQRTVQRKQMGTDPHVGTVECHEDGHVAHEEDATLIGVLPQRRPLFEEVELPDAVHHRPVPELPSPTHQGLGFAWSQSLSQYTFQLAPQNCSSAARRSNSSLADMNRA